MEDTINEANLETFAGLYAKGDYPNAMIELQKLKETLSPGVWHFNMGTLKARLMSPAEARFHFIEARLNGLSDSRLNDNLQLIEDQLEVTKLEKPLSTEDYLIKFSLWAQEGFFTMLSLGVLIGGLFWVRRQRKYSVFAFVIILVTIPIAAQYWVSGWAKAVVLVPHPIQEGPSAIFPARGEIPPGVMVVTKISGEWREVIFPSRFQGWVKNTGLKELE